MKNKFKLFGTQSLLFCVITLTALFAFALLACDNGTTNKSVLTGTVTITGGSGEDGAFMVSDTLTANTDSLGGSGKISYQWQSSDDEKGTYTNIDGKTGKTFDTTSQYADKWIRVVVSRADNTGKITSAAVQIIAGENDLEGTVTITNSEDDKDTYDVGDTLTAGVSDMTPTDGFTYQWQSSDDEDGEFTDIEDATESTYQIPEGMEGKWIRVVVSHPDYTGRVTSDPVQVNTTNENTLYGQVDIPWIIVVGQTIEADVTQLDEGGTISYQWMKSDDQSEFTNITGATGATFQVPNDLSGKYLQVVVSRAGKTGTVTSNSVKIRAAAPVVSGVTINEGDVAVSKDSNHSFTATVEGTNLEPEDQQVTWSVTGGNSFNTHISGGWLNVGADETADELTVTATSDIDPTKSDEVTVTVTAFSGNTITITGLGSMKGSIGVHILSSLDPDAEDASVASGYADITDESITVNLKVFAGLGVATPWEDTGEFYIKFEGLYDSYVYTDGEEIDMTDIDSNAKYDFQDKNTTIDFSKFAMIPLGEGGYKITISGLGSYNGAMASVELLVSSDYGSYPVADGHAIISDDSVTITLSDANDYTHLTGWTDGGECFIKLSIDDSEWVYSFVYTNGSSLTSLSISTWNDFYEKAPTVNFSSDTTSVSFDKFVPGDDIDYGFGGW
jgi:hypothetical protein